MDLSAHMKGSSSPLLWDGGLGTALLGRGLDLSIETPEAWLLHKPAEIRNVHAEFERAGCNVVQTNTFGLLRTSDPPEPLITLAVAQARQGAPTCQVVGSLGPTGKGDNQDLGALTDRCAQIAAAFVAKGVHSIHLETCCEKGETLAAMRGLRQVGVEVLVSVTVTVGISGLETPLGVPLLSMLSVFDREPPDVLGANCSQNGKRMVQTVEALWAFSRGALPILAQPQIDPEGPECKRRVPKESPAAFAVSLQDLLQAGATAVGGCCGVTAEHLAAFAKSRRSHDSLQR